MGIRLRVALLSAIALAALAGAASIILTEDMRLREERLVQRSLVGVAQHLAKLIFEDMEHHDRFDLSLSANMEIGTLVDSVDIVDLRGFDLADTAHNGYAPDRRAVMRAIRTKKPIVGPMLPETSGVVPVIGPDGDVVGAIVMHINTERERRRLAESRAKAAAIVATGAVAGLGIAYFLSAFLVLPLRPLVRGMRRMASGDGDGHVDLPSAPEYKELVENFNAMAAAVTRRAHNLELLNQMAADITVATHLTEIAEVVRRTCLEMLGGESRLWVFDKHADKLGSVPAFGQEQVIAERACPVSKVAREMKVLVIGTGDGDLPPGSRLAITLPPVLSAVMVPLHSPEGIVGTLSIEGISEERFNTQLQISIAKTIASIVGPVVAALLKAESQARSARMLQTILVPELPPAISGLEIAVRYQPAEEMGRFGGDYYDFVRLSDSEWCVEIGDVSGKGLSAAQHAANARYAFRSYLLEYRHIDQAMALTNSALFSQFDGENFITIFCGVINTADRTIRHVRAGHPPPIMHSQKSGEIRHLSAPGITTGIVADVEYTETIDTLSSGDTMLLYTDGLSDAKSGSEVFGEERLGEVVSRYAHLSVQGLANNILREVTLFSGGRLADDAALIVIRIE